MTAVPATPRIRCLLVVGLLATGTLPGPRSVQAQTEVAASALWASAVAVGGYLGVHQDWLVGAVRFDTTWVSMPDGGQAAIPRRIGRVWTVTGWAGMGVVKRPGRRGPQVGLHGQLGITRRRFSGPIDRVGLMLDGFAIQWGAGASLTARLKAAVWVHGGAIWARRAAHPTLGIRIQKSIIEELGRFWE